MIHLGYLKLTLYPLIGLKRNGWLSVWSRTLFIAFELDIAKKCLKPVFSEHNYQLRSRAVTTESAIHRIRLRCICWLCTVVNSYIKIKFDVNYSFAHYNMDSSMYVLGAVCCHHIQIHQKLNITLNSMFGTFSGIWPWPTALGLIPSVAKFFQLKKLSMLFRLINSAAYRKEDSGLINVDIKPY